MAPAARVGVLGAVVGGALPLTAVEVAGAGAALEVWASQAG